MKDVFRFFVNFRKKEKMKTIQSRPSFKIIRKENSYYLSLNGNI